jgi:hypothetical protein
VTAPISEINRASKTYDAGPPAVDQLSLTGWAAEARAVLGPSGSGKSTLLNVIAGPGKPTSGQVTVGRIRVDALSEAASARYRRKRIGMQSGFPAMTSPETGAPLISPRGDHVTTPNEGCMASTARARPGTPIQSGSGSKVRLATPRFGILGHCVRTAPDAILASAAGPCRLAPPCKAGQRTESRGF